MLGKSWDVSEKFPSNSRATIFELSKLLEVHTNFILLELSN